MQSKIWIDIDYDNQPILRIDYQPSDDVKDKLVKRFMETFGMESWFATFFYDNKTSNMSANNSSNNCAIIRPIPVQNLGIHLPDMKMVWEKYYENQQLAGTPVPETK